MARAWYYLYWLGTARTGAYFSMAPFIGAAIAIGVFYETTSSLFWAALILMMIGVVLHLTEEHVHEHTHKPLSHSHEHIHDAHHQHGHDFPGMAKNHTHIIMNMKNKPIHTIIFLIFTTDITISKK